MRTHVGRTALRGATQLLSGGAPRGAVLVGRTALASKSLCTNTSLHNDGARKPEDLQISANDKVQLASEAAASVAPQEESVVEIISEDVSSTSVLVEEQAVDGSDSAIESAATESNPPPELSKSAALPSSQESSKDPKEFAAHLNSLLRKGAVRTALWQFSNVLKTSNFSAVNQDAVKLMIPVLGRSGWSPTSLQTLQLAAERQYELGTGLYNCGLHAIARSGDTDAMRNIIATMWTLPKESQPNATSYNYLIGAYMYRGNVDDAFNVLNEMKDHLIYPTFATYHALITGCLRRRDSQRAFSTLMAVEKQRFDVSAMTVAQVLVSAANNDDFDNVRELLEKFESALPRYVAEVHRIAESRNMYRFEKHTRTTKEERASIRGAPKLEIAAISAVLHCAFRGGLPDVALRAWQLMEELYPELEPPPSLWYCLIGALSGGGDFSTALDVVGVMRERGLTPSLRDLDMALVRPLASDIALIDAQFYRLVDRFEGKELREEKHGEGAMASAASEEEEEEVEVSPADAEASETSDLENADNDLPQHEEIKASEQDLGTLEQEVEDTEQDLGELEQELEASETSMSGPQEGELDEAHKEYIRTRLRPTTVGIAELNCIISACSSAQDLERAFQTYDEVEGRFGLDKDIDTINALLEGCVQTKHIRGGVRILQEMESQGFSLSGQTLHLAVRLMIRGGQSERTMEMVEEAHKNGDYVSPSTYQMLIKHFLRNDGVKRARRVMELGMEAGLLERALIGRLHFEASDQLKELEKQHESVEKTDSSWSDQQGDELTTQSKDVETVGYSGADDEHIEAVDKH